MCLRGHVPADYGQLSAAAGSTAPSGAGQQARVDKGPSLAPAAALALPVRLFLQHLGGRFEGIQDWPLKGVKVNALCIVT
jgi:hypothetical protein